MPDIPSRERDKEAGYHLGANVGHVVGVDWLTKYVTLHWQHAGSWHGMWSVWLDPKTNQPYEERVRASDLLLNEQHSILLLNVRLLPKGRMRIQQSSLTALGDLLPPDLRGKLVG